MPTLRSIMSGVLLTASFHLSAAVSVQISVIDDQCTQSTGRMKAIVSAGVGPFNFTWSPAPPNGQGTNEITGLLAGSTYQVIVTDANLDSDTATATVGDHTFLYYASMTDLGNVDRVPCPGSCDGELRTEYEEYWYATPPYTVSPSSGSATQVNDYWVLGNYCLGEWVDVTITDANGCSTTLSTSIVGPDQPGPMSATQIIGSCTGGNNGSVTLDVPEAPNGWDTGLEVRPQGGSVVYSTWNLGSPVNVFDLGPGNYIADRVYGFVGHSCGDTYSFTIPDIGPNCGEVSGRLFVDSNADCVQDPLEPSVAYQVIEVTPGPYYTIVDQSGDYSLSLPYGSYDLDYTAPGLFPICPPSRPVPFTLTMGTPNVTVDLADSSNAPLDLRATILTQAARPGFTTSYHISVRNLSAKPSGAVTLVMDHDPALVLLDPAGATVTGPTQLTWNLPAMAGYANTTQHPVFQVPVSTPLGSTLTTQAQVSNSLSDADPSNDVDIRTQIVTGSYDPNDKLSEPANVYDLNTDGVIDYTIRFQNTGTDTAFNVLITDTLPAGLDPLTFTPTGASHPYTLSMEGAGILKFQFSNILLPDSNVNEPLSHGAVGFRIWPRQPFLPGDSLVNIANIYFDFNAPVITEPCVLVASIGTGLATTGRDGLAVFPNPAADDLTVTMERPMQQLELRYVDGRLARSWSVNGSTRSTLDLTGLARGIYLLSVQDGTGMHGVRVVKQ
ncbi:MAG: T9SS type A sorting domain-containing protein [Flavobacteriales bacterium]